MKVMPEIRDTTSMAVLDLAHTRLPVCPRSAQHDLLVCLMYLREARTEQGETEKKLMAIAAVDRHFNKAIAIGSKGLSPREDRALSLMVMAITAMRDNTPAGNAQAERILSQIRLSSQF
jgi:hypothetical protein